MMHLYDAATMAHALTLDLEPQLRKLLTDHIATLVTPDYDLTDYTEYLVVEAGDTEADIIRHVGFSPLTEPIDGIRFGDDGFHPFWDWLVRHDGWFEMIVTVGNSGFALIMFFEYSHLSASNLTHMLRLYTGLLSNS
ncbi:hypothetical protein [Sphingomonas mollis]|uniref:Uncharacterized protein n=1 Tax=Sphingomonas mollis TaxID=2795726 RepID=A0ABS0XMW3_9SPHN|nr:hypothetical protein [Sphingomonas sp. BT553]MBJ6121376.1 hypothetical protein [Sphingomonas sp. BT553]